MFFATLDMIVRRSLLEKSLPIHWYAEYLFHSSACIRDLAKDTLKIINCVDRPVNSYGAINTPDDFMDDLAVCIPAGQSLHRLPKQDWITPLRINNPTTGAFESYNSLAGEDEGEQTVWGLPGTWTYFWNVNDFGEPTGRFYGAEGGTNSGYKLIKERRQIQLTEDFIFDDSHVVLLYVSNGQSVDNATQVDFMAFSAVQRYNDWMSSPNAGIVQSPEGYSYYNERRLLRANLDDLTATDIRNIIHKNFMAAAKT